jgi:hypothetical protein
MATLYKIELSGAEEKTALSVQQGNKVVDQDVSIRDIEIEVLDICVGLAATREKDLRKYSLCKDLYGQIRELSKSAGELTDLTKEDIDIIRAGFSISAELQGGRPFKWMRCGKLFDQILEPVEKTEKPKK